MACAWIMSENMLLLITFRNRHYWQRWTLKIETAAAAIETPPPAFIDTTSILILILFEFYVNQTVAITFSIHCGMSLVFCRCFCCYFGFSMLFNSWRDFLFVCSIRR